VAEKAAVRFFSGEGNKFVGYTYAMPEDLQNRIVGIIQKVSKRPVEVGPDDSLFDSGLLDSFALPDMVTAIENEFGIQVPDADLTPRKFESIASIGRYIESRA
jgi:D-alanine--poly(phosphoribitol) ligase subunit 2